MERSEIYYESYESYKRISEMFTMTILFFILGIYFYMKYWSLGGGGGVRLNDRQIVW